MLRDCSCKKRPLAGAHRRQITARPVDYTYQGKRLYAGWVDGVHEVLFVGKVENGLLCFAPVTPLKA